MPEKPKAELQVNAKIVKTDTALADFIKKDLPAIYDKMIGQRISPAAILDVHGGN